MSDYIKREDAIFIALQQPIYSLVSEIRQLDGIDIVKCKECRHKYQEPWHNGVKVEGECEIWHNATLDDDFCSYGERSRR